MVLRKECLDDLAKSGLTPQDVGAREAGAPELAAVKLSPSTIGYIIPYYDIAGKRIPFYRLKLINNAKMKYKQPSGTANHLYFPAQFAQTLQRYLSTKPKRPVILLTEGEKKAVAGCKAGYPTVALGGVDSWRSRTIIMPKETVLSTEGDWLRAKIPSGGESKIDDVGKAIGLQSLFDLCSDKGITLMIVYDTDSSAGVRFEVQRAAAMLAHEAHFRGCKISQIRQLVLPFSEKLGKVGLDDYLVHKNAKALGNLIEGTLNKRSAFPRMPNVKKVLNEKLQSSRLQRSETQMIAAIMLAELDARGRRIRSAKDRQPYYFDEQACKLIPAQLINKQNEPLHEAPFGMYLYKEFGISSADTRVLTWLAAQFTGEEPVESAEPKRVISLVPGNEWEIAIQIGDSHFAIVSADEDFPVRIVTNGSKGLMFEQDQVEDVNPDDLMDAFDEQMEKPLKSWWHEIISAEFRIQGGDDAARLFALLFYISPFLLRWKGTQLPLELLIGEPGSGKSSLFALRLSVLTGRPLLRNVPRDMRDWYSSIVSTGGLHVIDNVAFTNKDLRQGMSDEICRIVTEPDPHIEMRKLFTTNSQLQIPVSTVFAMTAVQQPFLNSDILQRAAIFELDAILEGHTSDWVGKHMEKFGGRINWLAHHFVALHKFLVAAKEQWDNNYMAGHRLANYEQCLSIMARVLNLQPKGTVKGTKLSTAEEAKWIKKNLAASTQKSIINSDWTYNALKTFCEGVIELHPNGKDFGIHEFTAYFEASNDYYDHPLLINSRPLLRYMQANRTSLERMLGIRDLTHGIVEPSQKKFRIMPLNKEVKEIVEAAENKETKES